MRFTRTALAAAAALVLAACQDTPVAAPAADDDLYDLSKVTITQGDGSVPDIPKTGRRAPADPRLVCYPDGECEVYPRPKPLAGFDYGSYHETSFYGTSKQVHLVAWSDNYSNIESMTITGIFKSVGGQGPQGCNATPAEFTRQTKTGIGQPWGNYLTLFVERYATYPNTSTFVWQVDGEHYFLARTGYSVDGYYRSGTFYSSARVCY